MPRGFATVAMAILFAGYHSLVLMVLFPAPWLVVIFILTFIGGIMFGELFLRTRNIAWSIILHFVLNLNIMLIGWQYAG